MRPDDITPEEQVLHVLDATDEEVGPACMNVPCPPTIASDDDFREAYCQGYRHALADVRRAIALRDERVRRAERERIAQEIETQATERFGIARDQRAAKLSPAAEESYTIASTLAEAAALVREGGDTNAQ